jgi:hypothetical protein
MSNVPAAYVRHSWIQAVVKSNADTDISRPDPGLLISRRFSALRLFQNLIFNYPAVVPISFTGAHRRLQREAHNGASLDASLC